MILRLLRTLAALTLPAAALAQEAEAPSPAAIVATAAPEEWVAIGLQDLLVMELALGPDGQPRRVVIQLMPPPFSQGWVENIRTLARVGWYDGLSINRVQDNYVVQWGDPDGEDPAKAKTLPEGLTALPESAYSTMVKDDDPLTGERHADPYAGWSTFLRGWPVGIETDTVHSLDYEAWPVHCYAMVGVGRDLPPDTGSGAELYAVIGHAPRHLDRNIALVGRVIEGIEHLSSLPRGTGDLGFYETAEERVPIRSVRLGDTLPEGERPRFEYLSTESETFARYLEARANRRDAFFIQPAGGVDICNAPVPIRRVAAE